MGKAEKWKIDMEDAVVSRAMVTYNGKNQLATTTTSG